MSLEATIFGAIVTGLFIWSLFRLSAVTVVATVLLAGWLAGQLAQGISGTNVPLTIYVVADFVSAEVLFIMHAAGARHFYVWAVGTIYAFMMLCHSLFSWGILTAYEHWVYLTILFSLQLLITGGRIYAERDSVRSRNSWFDGKDTPLVHRRHKKEAK